MCASTSTNAQPHRITQEKKMIMYFVFYKLYRGNREQNAMYKTDRLSVAGAEYDERQKAKIISWKKHFLRTNDFLFSEMLFLYCFASSCWIVSYGGTARTYLVEQDEWQWAECEARYSPFMELMRGMARTLLRVFQTKANEEMGFVVVVFSSAIVFSCYCHVSECDCSCWAQTHCKVMTHAIYTRIIFICMCGASGWRQIGVHLNLAVILRCSWSVPESSWDDVFSMWIVSDSWM